MVESKVVLNDIISEIAIKGDKIKVLDIGRNSVFRPKLDEQFYPLCDPKVELVDVVDWIAKEGGVSADDGKVDLGELVCERVVDIPRTNLLRNHCSIGQSDVVVVDSKSNIVVYVIVVGVKHAEAVSHVAVVSVFTVV